MSSITRQFLKGLELLGNSPPEGMEVQIDSVTVDYGVVEFVFYNNGTCLTLGKAVFEEVCPEYDG